MTTSDTLEGRRPEGRASRLHVTRDPRLVVAIALGGAAGTLARVGLNHAFPFHGHGWPWATFTANLLGCALLGHLVTRLQERLPPSTYHRPLLGTGFCGALTTFSTFQVETLELGRNGQAALAAAYAAASIAGGLACVFGATVLTRRAGRR